MIFRLIAAQFDLTGISEISHCHQMPSQAFFPTDPEHALHVGGVIDREEFAEIFLERIEKTIARCQKLERKPLIREHTHSYFFNPDAEDIHPEGPSWITDQLFRRSGKRLKCIVTVRDPIDSWLSLSLHFPDAAPYGFDQYARYYLEFFSAYEEHRNDLPMLFLKYEDLIKDPARELGRIGQFLEIPLEGEPGADWKNVVSTGNSGRQSDELELRPRRPFDIEFLKATERSEAYRRLADKLGYNLLSESSGRAHLLSAKLSPWERRAWFGAARPIRKFRDWLMTKG